MNRVRSAGIIAAGEGARLKAAGILENKPLVRVSGYPLIGHTLRYYQHLGMQRVCIIFNEREQDCLDWVQKNFPNLHCEFIVKTTASSFESFWRLGQLLGDGRHLISTVDSICSAQELQKMQQFSDDQAIYLGVTSYVEDEKPLWLQMDEGSHQLQNLGGSSGNFVTAGFYQVPGTIFERALDSNITSLRIFLRQLFDEQRAMFGVNLKTVIDIDSPADILSAEKMLQQFK